MNFTLDIHFIVNKTFKMLGFIKINRINLKNIRPLNVIFFSLVRSNLEFGSVIWSPIYTIYIKHIENVQYNFFFNLLFSSDTSSDTYNLKNFSIQNFIA